MEHIGEQMISIVIPGKPIAKHRPRFARRGKHVVTYSDQQEDEVKFISLAQLSVDEPMSGPLKAQIEFYMPRPKSHYGTGKNSGILKPNAPGYHTVKPDTDNLIKFVLDCLNGIAFHDDALIFSLYANKYYAQLGRERTVIAIAEMEL